jgi:Rrf2 family protein
MLLSRTTQYTVQALIYLAQQTPGRKVQIRDIADALALPVFYLAKLLQPAARAGWIDTARGRSGGVNLSPGAEGLTLMDILAVTERNKVSQECLLGFKTCGDDGACVLHCEWKPIKEELTGGLARHRLADLAKTALPPWLLGESAGMLE